MGSETTGHYLKVVKASTIYQFYYSTDGIGWMLYLTKDDDSVTATRIGLAVNEGRNSGTAKLHVDYFRKTA